MQQDIQVSSHFSQQRSLGDFLRLHRLRLGLTQETLGKTIGASPRSIRRWEQDLSLPQGASRERLCQLFGVDFHQWLVAPPGGAKRASIAERTSASQSFSLQQQHAHRHLVAELPVARQTKRHIPPSISSQREQLLLASQLHPPCPPSTLILRERLLKRLDAAQEYRLVLLCASAGWGKTTLLSTWAMCYPHQVAWVSLNELDTDPTHFWVLVIAALRTCLPAMNEMTLELFQSSHRPTLTTMLTVLIHEIEAIASASEIFLVLDDYQIIKDQSIHEGLAFLLEHLPAHLHLVLSSRTAPPLPLSRLRVRGLMLELDDSDLRFTPEETSYFLQKAMSGSLEQTDVQALQERTEGWIVGLQLAALAMDKRQDRSAFVKTFTGSHHLLLDYVQQEILQLQPPALQQFLLQTAVLTHMNASLCQAVTATPASQQMLETLERSHLFIVALDEERHWYRFHSLFREALLACLHTQQPELLPLLHQRAAYWHEGQGNIREAITHALAATDYEHVASLLECAAPRLWMNGGVKTVYAWIKQLPDAMLRTHARLALTSLLHLLQQTQYTPPAQRAEVLAQAEQIIARLEYSLQCQKGVGAEELETGEKLVYQRIRLLHGLSAMREAYLHGNETQLHAIVLSMQNETLEDDITWKMVPTFALMINFGFRGDIAAVLPVLLNVKLRARQAQDHFAIIRTMEWIAMVYSAAGRLHQAYEECLRALELLKQMGEQTPSAGYLQLQLAELQWMWNHLAEAHTYLHSLIQYARTWQNMDLLLWAYCKFVRVLLALGENAEAERMLEEAERLTQYNGFTLHRPRVMAARVQLWLAQGNFAAAYAWAANYGPMPDILEHIHEPEYFMLARVYLAQQKYTEALYVVALLLRRAQDDQRERDVVFLLALRVIALYSLGEMPLARQTAARLLHLSEPEGYLRVFLDAGEPMQQVLKTFLSAPHDQELPALPTPMISVPYVAQLVATLTQESGKPMQTYALALPVLPGTAVTPVFEPLTSRELEVLHLLAAGASNQEIARQLVISLGTVKKHVSNLLGKLGADNRTQALALARERSLLE